MMPMGRLIRRAVWMSMPWTFPNHGRSRGEHGSWTMEDCLSSINTVAKHIKAETGLPVFLLGSSQGSAFAWYGLNTSDAVTGAITLCLAAFHLSPFRDVIAPLRSDEFVAAMKFFRGSLQIDLKKFMRIEENYGSKEITDRLLADPDMTWVYDLAAYRELLLWEPANPASQNTKPLFVTVGEHDPFMPPAVVKMIADQIAGPVTYHKFKDAPHQVMLERTDEFIAAVDDWVASVS